MIAAIHQKWDVFVMKGNLFGEAKANAQRKLIWGGRMPTPNNQTLTILQCPRTKLK